MGPGSGSCSPTVRRGEARQERGEGRVDSPWGPWLPGQHRPCCVLAPRAPRLLLPGRLREGDQSVAPASSDVSLCPVATACPMSWSPPPSRPATPSGPRTGHHEAQGPVRGWAGRAGLAFSSGSLWLGSQGLWSTGLPAPLLTSPGTGVIYLPSLGLALLLCAMG